MTFDYFNLTDLNFDFALLRKKQIFGLFPRIFPRKMFFDRFFPKLLTVKAQEEELVDPQEVLRVSVRINLTFAWSKSKNTYI